MSSYTQLKNNLNSIGLLTFCDNIDTFIDNVNSGEKTLIDAFLELTKKEMDFKQDRVNRSMIKTAHFPFVKTFDDFDFTFQPSLNKNEILDLKILNHYIHQ